MTFLILLMLCFVQLSMAQDRVIPQPIPAQQVWQEAELTVVFHYDLHVFDGEKYVQSKNHITSIPNYNTFNPDQLDTDQWIRAAKSMGAKIAVLTVSHETGFALYQSDVNPYCLKALKWRNGKGDIVRDFVNSCRKYNIKPGLYIGTRFNTFLGVNSFMMPNDNANITQQKLQQSRQAAYNTMIEGMTEELMSRYGDLAMVWYDGGGHGPELGGPNILPIVEKYQKNIIFYHNTQRADIRWGGSETGTVPYPCWGTYSSPYFFSNKIIFKNNFEILNTGDPEGEYYMPAMSDAPLRGYKGRHDWFWEPDCDAHVFPLSNLMNMYYKSVGRNSTLILGLAPNDRGLMSDVDVKRLQEFGDDVLSRFGNAKAEIVGKGKKLSLKFDNPTDIRDIVLQEDIQYGERVHSYRIEAKVNGKWKILEEGSCIGHKRIIPVESVTVTAVRLVVTESLDTPQIKKFAIY